MESTATHAAKFVCVLKINWRRRLLDGKPEYKGTIMSEHTDLHLVLDTDHAELTAPSMSEHATPEAAKAQQANPVTVTITLECKIDLALLRKQKRALSDISEGAIVSYEQENVAEGMLNMLDCIQDSILEQGLATEEEIFPRLPQLFDSEPSSHDAAAKRIQPLEREGFPALHEAWYCPKQDQCNRHRLTEREEKRNETED
jgi:hypothetical protein